jgi:chromatin structure-remodeling complex protein RSC7
VSSGKLTGIGGRWVDDDYYESRSIEAGNPAGELVGDLTDANNEAAALNAAQALPTSNQPSGTGIYRAGGPTTIFGGSGWGPYSDGPLNPVRKGLLNREGVTEENWMEVAARRAREMDAEWAKIRRDNMADVRGALKDVGIATGGSVGQAKKLRGRPNNAEEEEEETDDDDNMEDEPRKTKRVRMDDGQSEIRGVYEPHNGTILCESV